MRFSHLVLLLLLAVLAGCNQSDSKKGAALPQPSSSSAPADLSHNLILRYNQLLIEGYKTANMTKLQEVTTLELAEKAYYHMAAIGEGKSRLVSELKKIDFLETDCSQPSKCRVVTRERWDFSYADLQTGQKSSEVKDYTYDVQYLTEKRQGRWIITEITASGEERKDVPSWKDMFRKK